MRTNAEKKSSAQERNSNVMRGVILKVDIYTIGHRKGYKWIFGAFSPLNSGI